MGVIARHSFRVGVVAVAAAAALVLSGCTGSSESSDGSADNTLKVWFPGNDQNEIDLVTKTIVPAFEKETGAKVEVTYVDWGDISTKLNAAFAAGTAPDVFGHGPAATADFVANDRLTPLTDYVAELSDADQQDMAAALPGGQVDGVQYLMPLSNQGSLIMYNADDFRAAGLDPDNPPTTWEGVEEAAEKLTVRDGSGEITRSGLLLPSQAIARQQSFATLAAGAGGSTLTDDNTAAAWNSPEGVQALDYFTALFNGPDAVSAALGQDYTNAPTAQQPLVLGTASMTMLSSTAMEKIKAAEPDKDLRVLPPVGFEGSDPAALGGAGTGLMINADSENQDLAWTFISYFLDPEVSAQYTQGIGAIPLRASAVDTDYVKSDPIMQAFLNAAPDYIANPNVAGWVQVRDILDKNLEQALHETVPSKDALDQAADEADPILQANG
ncbi:ABC transporter substrate-binding protein [Herbiconiux sp. CPCC 205763]|uniref:ABC transporter substrate-binding protein n=1 Tax=Herbiconiux aconitum TaxID=2970913 RepID=A0ABT2GVP7_9MICO|nr:ABC transporter substrate-binding protein [Herbiconiux aconitum]MCS5720216.1 ABC transporter substrate-binding protein [Herbiconiux aconitum]